MPIAGQGAVPTGALYNELTSVTRRAFVPRLFVQLYFATPTLFHLLGTAQKSAGGLNQITVPVQGNSMVQGQFTGYSGGFNAPILTPGIQNAQFSTCYWVVPVPLPFGETVIQATEREISLLKARMNDVYAVTLQQMGTLAFTNNTANPLYPNSFYDAYDNGTNVTTYGGINRSATPTWKGNYFSVSTAIASSGFTRQTMSNYVIQITNLAGGEAPSFAMMNPGDFATFNNTFIGVENIYVNPNRDYPVGAPMRTSFPNLNVAGVPIYADNFCPQGSMYFVNSKYLQLYLSEDAAFDFSGFYSLVPLGQIGQQGVMICGYNIICAKPSSGAALTGIGGNAF